MYLSIIRRDSISCLDFGAPKIWYVVPAKYTEQVLLLYAETYLESPQGLAGVTNYVHVCLLILYVMYT